MTEEEFLQCIKEMKSGDKNGLKKVYEAYVNLIYSVVFNKLYHQEEAEDITSEFFIKLFKNANKYKEGHKHVAWLVTVAKNMTIDFIRKNKWETPVDEFYQEAPGNLEEQIVNDITIGEAIKKLKPKEKEIVNLKIMGGFTFKEISKLCEMPMGTVTWHYNNAITKLRGCLNEK